MSTLTLEGRVAILEQELLLLKRQMRPVAALPFWQTATSQERAAAARQWAALDPEHQYGVIRRRAISSLRTITSAAADQSAPDRGRSNNDDKRPYHPPT